MHLTLTCEMHGFQIVQHILDNLRMMIIVCYLVSGPCVCFVRDFDSVTLLFSSTSVSGMCSEDNEVMLPKPRMEDTRARDQITCDNHYS
jgi:hypothetical protein